ncbi:MAG: hypothetical protein IJS82_03090 [Paludibacteraceae bacterium]|nr:hypothetical protein [Paludibacteraceae bacterium]
MKTKTASLIEQRPLVVLCLLSIVLIPLSTSCNPEAKWETQGVEVSMTVKTVSAGFVECSFSTNKDAYYLIAITEPWEKFNPVDNSKQFMQFALDSAYADYLMWRSYLLREKEFNVAPFASHSLQYGTVNHFFTGLVPEHDYWVFAFPVNPETMKPVGALVLEPITTKKESSVAVSFDYRVKDVWDYIYPLDTLNNVHNHFPYIATTRDSLELDPTMDPVVELSLWVADQFLYPQYANVFYGVKAVENEGIDSHLAFEDGHTYYTVISGFDFSLKQEAIYKFTWHPGYEHYFHDNDSTNLFRLSQNE